MTAAVSTVSPDIPPRRRGARNGISRIVSAHRCLGTPISHVSASSSCLPQARAQPWKRSILCWRDSGNGCSSSAKTRPQRTFMKLCQCAYRNHARIHGRGDGLLRKGGIDRHLAYDVLTNSLFDSRSIRLTGGKIVDERYTRPDSPYRWPPRTCISRSLPPRRARCQCPLRASPPITLSSWLPAGGRSWTGRLSACSHLSMPA
jgi:hypothetical protein